MPPPRTVPQRNPHLRQGGRLHPRQFERPSIKYLRDACRSSIAAGAMNIGQALFSWLQVALSMLRSDAGGVAGDRARLNQKQLHPGNTAQSHQAQPGPAVAAQV